MKMYILIPDDVPDNFVPVSVAKLVDAPGF